MTRRHAQRKLRTALAALLVGAVVILTAAPAEGMAMPKRDDPPPPPSDPGDPTCQTCSLVAFVQGILGFVGPIPIPGVPIPGGTPHPCRSSVCEPAHPD